MIPLLYVGLMASRLGYLIAVVPAFFGALFMWLTEWFLGAEEDLETRLRYARIARARRKLDALVGVRNADA